VRVSLIHNPAAGTQGKSGREQLTGLIRAAGHEVRYQSCKDEHWDKVLEEPADLVVVAGGDGTVSRVTKRMVDRGVLLSVLPAGTANNIARTLGLVERPWEELIRGWQEARRVKLDIGIADGPWGTRYFVEGIGVGLFAWTIPQAAASRTLESIERRDAKVAYALQMLKDRLEGCPSMPLRATLDGKEVSGEYVLFEALNLPFVGPNLFLAPDSKPGDGHLDVVLVTQNECDRVRQYLESWQEEKPRVAVLPTHKGRHLHLDWTGYEVHIDDQLWPDGAAPPSASGTIDVRIEGKAVEFLVPNPKQTR
jgi:diacylglycerol kinase family enzyme